MRSLRSLEVTTEARFLPRGAGNAAALARLNLKLEVLRCFWRTAFDRGFISARQALYRKRPPGLRLTLTLYLHGRLDEVGRMAGARSQSLKPKPREAG